MPAQYFITWDEDLWFEVEWPFPLPHRLYLTRKRNVCYYKQNLFHNSKVTYFCNMFVMYKVSNILEKNSSEYNIY